MCTLSWSATGSGYDLFFNRDELRTRASEAAPGESRHSGVRILAPRDGEGGGTWISVNEFGITNALLNGYFETRGRPALQPRSRGLLVLDLAIADSTVDVQARLETADLGAYEPFVLCSFEPVSDPARNAIVGRAFDWDGLDLNARDLLQGQAPECSSGVDAIGARSRRSAKWSELSSTGPMTPPRMAEFHRSHLDRADAHSPCMHREDAETRSMVCIHVDTKRVELSYTPGAPCHTDPIAPLMLPRRAPSVPLP